MKYLCAFILSILIGGFSAAQENDWEEFKESTGDFFTAPADFNGDDWLKTGGVIGAVGISSLFDQSIQNFSQTNKSDILDGLFSIDSYSLEVLSATTVLMYIYGWAGDDEKVRKLGLHTAEAVLYTELLTFAIKVSVGRVRPFAADTPFQFKPLGLNFEHRSLPSGHSSFAFAYATVMANEYNNILWKTAWFTTATIIGAARVYNNVHWFSDVVMGAAIGYFIGDFINRRESLPDNEKPAESLLPPVINFALPL